MIRIEYQHSKIVSPAFCFQIIDYDKIEFAKSGRALTKEFKLKVVQFFYDHGKNYNQTATHFKVDRKQVGILFIEIPTFIILFISLLLFQILCPHSISCFVPIFSY